MKKIIGFFGGDSQVGTTMISQSIAECLKTCGKQVLLIKGSGKYGEEFMNGDGRYSLDDIKANIISGKVSYEDMEQVIIESKGLFVISSVRNPFTSKYYPENTYEVMLASVADEFDYIVIDAGNDANLGLMISALNVSDSRYFVTTQQSKAIHLSLIHISAKAQGLQNKLHRSILSYSFLLLIISGVDHRLLS